jgi:hypothetical protein
MELTAAIQGLRGCKWVAIEADYKEAMEDLLTLQFYLTQDPWTSSATLAS